ncbi:HAD family hydrolase [Solilutibacter silvestris]
MGDNAGMSTAIRMVGFDADDTLWKSEDYYRAAEAEFRRIVGGYVDLADLGGRLYEVEKRNLAVFGYGAKGMVLSMVEAAIEITEGRIDAADIHRIVSLGRDLLLHPVEVLPGIPAAVDAIAERYQVVLITKGDLFHQEAKVRASGLAERFQRIEVVSEKDAKTYARLLREFGIQPAEFVMVGNSLRSDIAPVLDLGGAGVHMPYHVTWAHEAEHDVDATHPRLRQVGDASGIAAAVADLAFGNG